MSKNQSIWQNIVTIGKNILAHVNFSFNGADGSFHIDIVPVDPKAIVVEEEGQMVEPASGAKALSEKAGSIQQKGLKSESGAGNTGSVNLASVSDGSVMIPHAEVATGDTEAKPGDGEVAINHTDNADIPSNDEEPADIGQSEICHEG